MCSEIETKLTTGSSNSCPSEGLDVVINNKNEKELRLGLSEIFLLHYFKMRFKSIKIKSLL